MNMKQMAVIVVLLLVLSSFTVSAEEDSCAGFWGSLNCVLWGDPAVRENLAGESIEKIKVV